MTQDCTVTASFAELSPVTFTVTPSAGTGGSISPSSPQTVEDGSTTAFTVTPNSGYEIDTVGGTCGGTFRFSNSTFTTNAISQDCSVLASFGLVNGESDSDKDGVVDDIDLCPETASGGVVDEQGCSNADYRAREKAALIALYNSTNGDNWTDNTGWLTERDHCEWNGVFCEGADGFVTALVLVDNRLTGSMPAELGNLASLRELYLNRNQLTGSIPAELGNLSSLQYLELNYNQLSGSIPIALGSLLSLEAIELTANQLSGNIPLELGNLSSLQRLSIRGNFLEGSIPPQLGKLSQLSILNLDNNRLSGSIPPELGNLSALGILWLHVNQLTGSIPSELGNLSSLRSLSLYNNQLSGSISPELGNLSALGILWLHVNQLTGSIPAELGNLASLSRLNLTSNQLSGVISEDLGDYIAGLSVYDLGSNTFDCPYPGALKQYFTEIGEYCIGAPSRAAIERVSYVDGAFKLTISASDGGYAITSYDATCTDGTNSFTGSSTTNQIEVTGLTNDVSYTCAVTATNSVGTSEASASTPHISSNDTDGDGVSNEFDECPAITTPAGETVDASGCSTRDYEKAALVVLHNDTNGANWSNNAGWLAGDHCNWFGVVCAGNEGVVTQLVLRSNQLTGSIPAELGNLSSLQYLSLSGNQLTGGIPMELGKLPSLQYLYLSNNQLTGSIPAELGNLSSLYHLTLDRNQLSGVISESLGDFIASLGSYDLTSNSFACPYPSSLELYFSRRGETCSDEAAPSDVVIEQFDYTDGAITLTVSASNGGSTITSYDAICTDGINSFTGSSTTNEIEVAGLTNDVAYTCTVTATNSVGTSEASAATPQITPEEFVPAGLPIWLLKEAIDSAAQRSGSL